MARKTEMTGTTLSSAATPPPEPPMTPAGSVAAEGVVAPGSQPAAERKRWRDDPRVPAMLISTVLHTALLVILALFSFRKAGRESLTLDAKTGEPAAAVSLEALAERQDQEGDEDQLVERPVAVSAAPQTADVSMFQATDGSVDSRLVELSTAGRNSQRAPSLVRIPKGGLSARTPQGRVEFGNKYGATAESEQAVDAALRWLSLHQRSNGSWSFNLDLDPCNGRCRHSNQEGEPPKPSTAATGLALLAFLGAGHTHYGDGPYADTVRRGIYYLRSVAGEAATGYDWQRGSMYGHGIALMALAEALAMSEQDGRVDSDLRSMVLRGASFTSAAQHDNGSWGYVPGSPGDTTVSGWQILSLIAAKRSEIDLRTHTLRDSKRFLMSTCTDRDYWFGYKGPPGEPTTTAIGLTLMLYLGESPDYTPFYKAIGKLAERGPMLTNVYHDYYGTLALHHCRHHQWDSWNTTLRDHLVATQGKTGHEQGSWHFQDRWGDVGGRLYTTAMCAMILEVYYRYLPLYGPIESFPLQ